MPDQNSEDPSCSIERYRPFRGKAYYYQSINFSCALRLTARRNKTFFAPVKRMDVLRRFSGYGFEE